jgi:hypothetical protein
MRVPGLAETEMQCWTSWPRHWRTGERVFTVNEMHIFPKASVEGSSDLSLAIDPLVQVDLHCALGGDLSGQILGPPELKPI